MHKRIIRKDGSVIILLPKKETKAITFEVLYKVGSRQEYSGQKMTIKDDDGKDYIPNVIETSGGIDRTFLAFLMDAYTEIDGGRTTTTKSTKEKEVVLKLHPRLAPIKIAILPLSKKADLSKKSQEVYNILVNKYRIQYDETGSIGKRYRRQDEIGTPYCLTIDFDSLEDNQVTIRDRDTMKQERIAIKELENYFKEKLN